MAVCSQQNRFEHHLPIYLENATCTRSRIALSTRLQITASFAQKSNDIKRSFLLHPPQTQFLSFDFWHLITTPCHVLLFTLQILQRQGSVSAPPSRLSAPQSEL